MIIGCLTRGTTLEAWAPTASLQVDGSSLFVFIVYYVFFRNVSIMNPENSAAVGGMWTNPSSTDYLTRALTLLAEYQWIYDFKLTNFLRDRVWENVPPQVNSKIITRNYNDPCLYALWTGHFPLPIPTPLFFSFQCI